MNVFFRDSYVRASTWIISVTQKHARLSTISLQMTCTWCNLKHVFIFFPCDDASITPFIWMIFSSQHLAITTYFSRITSNNNLHHLQSLWTWHCIDSYPVSSRCDDVFLLIWFRTIFRTYINIASRRVIICLIFCIISIIVIFLHWRIHHYLAAPSSLQADFSDSHLWYILTIQECC